MSMFPDARDFMIKDSSLIAQSTTNITNNITNQYGRSGKQLCFG